MLKEILWRGKSCVYSSTLKFLNNVAFGVCNIICNQIYLKYIFIWKLKCKFRPLSGPGHRTYCLIYLEALFNSNYLDKHFPFSLSSVCIKRTCKLVSFKMYIKDYMVNTCFYALWNTESCAMFNLGKRSFRIITSHYYEYS